MAVRIVGNLTLVSPPDLHVPSEEILTGRGDREVIDTGVEVEWNSPKPYRVYIAPETVVDWARDLDLVPQSDLDDLRADYEAQLEAERQKKVEVETVLEEAFRSA